MNNNLVIESIRRTPVVFCRGFLLMAGKDWIESYQDHHEKGYYLKYSI